MKKNISTIVLSLFLISTIGGCASTSDTQGKTLLGAGLGAIAGGVIGLLETGKIEGALTGAAIGAAAGAIAGYAKGKYDEKQLQTRAQVYKKYPAYSNSSSSLEPTVKDLKANILNKNQKPVKSFTEGQTIWLESEYTILASPNVKKVEVQENNYLILPDGKTKMDDTKRIKQRDVGRISGKQEITMASDLLPGKYTHVAIVKIGDKPYTNRQIIEVVASLNRETEQYAFKDASY